MGYTERSFSFPGPTELDCYYCGKRTEELNHEYPMRLYEYYIFVFVKSGSATLRTPYGFTRVKGPALMVLYPYELVGYKTDTGVLWTIWWVNVSGPMVLPLLESLSLSRERPVIRLRNSGEVELAYEALLTSMEKTGFADRLESISRLMRLFSALAENGRTEEADMVIHASHMIEFSYGQAISLASIAESLNVDKCYLAKRFRAQTGETVGERIRSVRIQRACALLQNTNLPLQEVASSVGIQDGLYFSRVFRKVMGQSPSEYRASFRRYS